VYCKLENGPYDKRHNCLICENEKGQQQKLLPVLCKRIYFLGGWLIDRFPLIRNEQRRTFDPSVYIILSGQYYHTTSFYPLISFLSTPQFAPQAQSLSLFQLNLFTLAKLVRFFASFHLFFDPEPTSPPLPPSPPPPSCLLYRIARWATLKIWCQSWRQGFTNSRSRWRAVHRGTRALRRAWGWCWWARQELAKEPKLQLSKTSTVYVI